MSNETISVPPYIGLEPLRGLYYPAKCRRCGWVGSSSELTEDDAQCTRQVGDHLCLGDCDELDGHELLGIIQAMAKHQGKPADWAVNKPVAIGAYWIRGNGLEREALIEVIQDEGELRCNLHQRTTDSDFGYGYSIDQLSDEFEWRGPLYTRPAEQPAPAAVVLPERMPTGNNVEGEHNRLSPGVREGWNLCLDEVARFNPPQQ